MTRVNTLYIKKLLNIVYKNTEEAFKMVSDTKGGYMNDKEGTDDCLHDMDYQFDKIRHILDKEL
jgi:hypothetical protein